MTREEIKVYRQLYRAELARMQQRLQDAFYGPAAELAADEYARATVEGREDRFIANHRIRPRTWLELAHQEDDES